jgi:dienelactone hydrolase/pimeloyl-ACP methyl ester carboxylesterase
MVQEYYVERLRQIERHAVARLMALKTKADAEAYVAEVKKKIQNCFGPWPERTPLNPRVTGSVERDTYRIENVIFESRPQFYVTANLYLPKRLNKPAPGVVGSCGHSANGKAHEAYQSFAQGLARQGYVCLIFDPIGQGERLQFTDDDLKPRINPGTAEHLMAGNQQFLVGEFFGSWRAWDGMRALDYLLSREEVDPKHVGITGNSGGGTMTTWLCGVENRWTMAAPSCFVTTFRRNMENELPADTEQCPPRVLSFGLDQSDFLVAMAPKPVIVVTQEQDFFDVRGSAEALARLKHIYGLLGAADNVAMFTGPGGHGYDEYARTAMYGWFNRATGIGEKEPKEPQLKIEEDKTLWCTKNGQVAELKSRTVYSFTQQTAKVQAAHRHQLETDDLKRTVASVLRLPTRSGAPDYRILRPRKAPGFPTAYTSIYAVETEPGIQAIVYRPSETPLYSRPSQQTNTALLYIAHDSSDAELRGEPLVRELLESNAGCTLYACDVRGLGESKPNTAGERNSYSSAYGNDYFYSSHAIMLNEPYVGRRTHDVLSVLDWIAGIGHAEVHLAGLGYGAIPAAYAALLHDRVKQITIKHGPTSYQDIVTADLYKWPLSSFTPNVIRYFDLPDVYTALATKKFNHREPWDANLKVVI